MNTSCHRAAGSSLESRGSAGGSGSDPRVLCREEGHSSLPSEAPGACGSAEFGFFGRGSSCPTWLPWPPPCTPTLERVLCVGQLGFHGAWPGSLCPSEVLHMPTVPAGCPVPLCPGAPHRATGSMKWLPGIFGRFLPRPCQRHPLLAVLTAFSSLGSVTRLIQDVGSFSFPPFTAASPRNFPRV